MSRALAEPVAAAEPAFVAPLIPVGYSKALMDFPGTLNVRPASLVAYTRDVAESYIGWGCKRILFINGHASEFGTSVMLHLAGEHVKMERAVRTEPKSGNAFPDFIRPRRYGDSTDTGVVGDGTLGTAEKGAETVRRAVARTLEFIRSDEFATPA